MIFGASSPGSVKPVKVISMYQDCYQKIKQEMLVANQRPDLTTGESCFPIKAKAGGDCGRKH
jgi:hypothetical protein